MIEISIEEILKKAGRLSQQKNGWHFHILAPGCLLSTNQDYSLILECPLDNQSFINYSKEKPMAAGKELVKLLHGSDVVQEGPEAVSNVSPGARAILQRAKEINQRGDFWHHHMLFPDCAFNKNKGKWTVTLEDPQSKEILESVTKGEPKEDLKQIESLFYSQQS